MVANLEYCNFSALFCENIHFMYYARIQILNSTVLATPLSRNSAVLEAPLSRNSAVLATPLSRNSAVLQTLRSRKIPHPKNHFQTRALLSQNSTVLATQRSHLQFLSTKTHFIQA